MSESDISSPANATSVPGKDVVNAASGSPNASYMRVSPIKKGTPINPKTHQPIPPLPQDSCMHDPPTNKCSPKNSNTHQSMCDPMHQPTPPFPLVSCIRDPPTNKCPPKNHKTHQSIQPFSHATISLSPPKPPPSHTTTSLSLQNPYLSACNPSDNPSTPPPSSSFTLIPPNQNLSKSRKRQRKISPIPSDTLNLDLNSPPPSSIPFLNHEPIPLNSAPPRLNKYSEYSTRIPFPPVSFETLLNHEFPPLNPNPPPIPPPPPFNPPDTTSPNNPLTSQPSPTPHSDEPSHPPSFEDELRETIVIGDCVGINLAGHEDKVAEIISANRANNVSQ